MKKGLFASVLALAILGTAPAAQASLSWDTSAFDFGSQEVGLSSTSRTFTLTATCDAGPGIVCTTPLAGIHNYGSVSAPGLDFNIDTTTCSGMLTTLSFPGTQSCTATVAFKPSAKGLRSGTLQTGTGQVVALSGTGTEKSLEKGGDGSGKKCSKKKRKKNNSASAAKKKKKCKKKK